MFNQFILLENIEEPELDIALSQNDLYSKLNPSDIASLPEIKLNNFVNICNFVNYYQLKDESEFIANIQYHILCQTIEVIANINQLSLHMQQKVYQNECLIKRECINCFYYKNIKHIACYKYFKRNGVVNYGIDEASSNGHLELIKYLFKIGEDCTTYAINWASKNGHLEVIKYLFEDKHKNGTKWVIFETSQSGRLDVIKYLFEVQHINCNGTPCIEWASRYGHLDVVKYLFEVMLHTDCEETAIDWACEYGHLEVVKYLLDVAHKDSEYAMDRASESGHLDIVKYLFEIKHKKCSKQHVDKACGRGQLNVVKYFFEVVHQDCTSSAINMACEYGHLDVLKYLIEVQHKTCTSGAIYFARQNDDNDDDNDNDIVTYLKSHPDSFIE